MDAYQKLEQVGEGTYGVVFRGLHKDTGRIVAVKRIKAEEKCDEGVSCTTLREISILRQLKHDNIVLLLNIETSDKLFLIFEFISMDLRNYLDQFDADEWMDARLVKKFTYQINDAILYCHKRAILHRDLKPQNLLLSDNGQIKVADFGLGRICSIPVKPYTREVFTLWYRPPEILLGSRLYSCPIDMWSLGCVFAEMCTKAPLFPGESEIDQLFHIFHALGTPNEHVWPGVENLPDFRSTFPTWDKCDLREKVEKLTDAGIDLLEQLLTYDPTKRISAKRAVDHPYFKNIDLTIKPLIKKF